MKLVFKKKFVSKIILSVFFFALPSIIFAESGVSIVSENLQETATGAGIDPNRINLPTILGATVNYLFGIIGVVFFIVMLTGGLNWMMAGGQEEKVKAGKELIIWGINGIIIIFFAYALVYIILAALKGATG